jgi:DNA adenine methylase
MRYLGGKSRLGKQIAYVINSIRKPGQPYWEPFCGSCWVTIHVRGEPRYCSDGCYELVEMWKALQNGWKPPRVVTEEMYAEAKAGKYDPALTAFIGFGCSFGGKWFAGYARDPKSDRNYAANSENSIAERLAELCGVRFFYFDYRRMPPQANVMIYCDPPYAGTTGYKALGVFDVDEFWQTVRNWRETGHIIIVSEYTAPDDFVCVLEMQTRTDLETAGGGKDPRTERLFMHRSQAHLYYDNVPEQLEMGF